MVGLPNQAFPQLCALRSPLSRYAANKLSGAEPLKSSAIQGALLRQATNAKYTAATLPPVADVAFLNILNRVSGFLRN